MVVRGEVVVHEVEDVLGGGIGVDVVRDDLVVEVDLDLGEMDTFVGRVEGVLEVEMGGDGVGLEGSD